MFWLTITAMLMIALAIILVPLLRKSAVKSENRSQQNISIAQEKLAELKQALQQGKIDDQTFSMSQDELEQTLHNDLESNKGAVDMAIKSPYKTGIAIGIALPVIAIALYYSLGSPDSITTQKRSVQPSVVAAMVSENTRKTSQVDDVRTMFERLKQKLEANPDNGQGWMMMGLSYMHFNRYKEAIEAYQKAVNLSPDDPAAGEALSRARVAQSAINNGKEETIEKKMKGPDGQVVDVGAMVTRLRKRLESNPDNFPGWVMLGRSYMNLGRYSGAVSAYQSALAINPADPEATQLLQAALGAEKVSINP